MADGKQRAIEAQVLFEAKNYDTCIMVLEALRKERPEDEKVNGS